MHIAIPQSVLMQTNNEGTFQLDQQYQGEEEQGLDGCSNL